MACGEANNISSMLEQREYQLIRAQYNAEMTLNAALQLSEMPALLVLKSSH
jgi:hypothetical protein